MNTSSNNQSLVERLFAVGAHFGFKKSRRHPTVVPYLYGMKDGNDIFDLEKTASLLAEAAAVMKTAGSQQKTVLFVGTKTEAARLVTEAAESAGMPYVTNRWIGGMLTNWTEIKKRIGRLETLRQERDSGELERKYTKKERVVLGREVEKLEFNFGGIATMGKLPDLMLVVDPRHDAIAVAEAKDRGIPVIALMSSDCDAAPITYPVILNDSLQASVRFALAELTAAYAAGKSGATTSV